MHIVTQFMDEGGLSDEEGPQFNNLVVDKNTGRVYIGAVNKLYQLSPNLEQMVSISGSVKQNCQTFEYSFPISYFCLTFCILGTLKSKLNEETKNSGLIQLFQIGTVTGPSLDSPHCSVLPDCPPQVYFLPFLYQLVFLITVW